LCHSNSPNTAVLHGFSPFFQEGHEFISLDYKNEHDRTPLMYCSIKNHREILQGLLAAKASTDVACAAGNTPLLLAAHFGQPTILRELAAANADINKQDVDGESPLHRAAFQGHERIVTQLVPRADPLAACTTQEP